MHALRNPSGGENGAERQAASQRLGDGDHVRQHTIVLVGKVASSALMSKASASLPARSALGSVEPIRFSVSVAPSGGVKANKESGSGSSSLRFFFTIFWFIPIELPATSIFIDTANCKSIPSFLSSHVVITM